MIDLKKKILKMKEKILLLNIKIFFNIPNILTFTRILLIIPFSISLLSENYIKAFEILIFSGITDFLDGFFARILHQQTKLSRFQGLRLSEAQRLTHTHTRLRPRTAQVRLLLQ